MTLLSKSTTNLNLNPKGEHYKCHLKSKCKLIGYPSATDLDDSVPYWFEIIQQSNSSLDIRTTESRTFYSTCNNKQVFSHFILRVYQNAEMSHNDIFKILQNSLWFKFWYQYEKEFAISDLQNPFKKISHIKTYNMIAYIFHNTGKKVNT